jgi:hypothetical protein
MTQQFTVHKGEDNILKVTGPIVLMGIYPSRGSDKAEELPNPVSFTVLADGAPLNGRIEPGLIIQTELIITARADGIGSDGLIQIVTKPMTAN